MSRIVILALGWCAILTMTPPLHAGLYQKDVLGDFDIDKDGFAIQLSLNAFLDKLGQAAGADNPQTPKSQELGAAVSRRREKGKLSAKDSIAQSADLLRMRRNTRAVDEAMNLLQPMAQRPPEGVEFFALTHLAHGHVLSRDWSRAYELQFSAVKDYPFPKSIEDLSENQVKWYRRLEGEYYLPFLRHRKEETDRRKPSIRDGLDPIFPALAKRKGRSPVAYVGENGQYVPGNIADAELKKIPPDAIAILQQMILWDSDDNRLLWQLGEVYNAIGDIRSAAKVFNLLLDINGPRKYTNPELMKHAAEVRSAVGIQNEIDAQAFEIRKRAEEEEKRAEEQRKRRDAEETRLKFLAVMTVVAAVLVFLSYWQTREFLRRLQARRAKAGNSANQVD